MPRALRPPTSLGFRPWEAPQPPTGSYDPALDAQVGAAGRGLQDLQQDVGTQNLRDTVDYGVGREDILRQQTRGTEDLGLQRGQVETGYGRSLADLQSARARGGEDYNRNVEMLTRRYQQLGDTQRQQQSRAGVVRGGAMLQAAAKRSGNQALDRQPLDTSFQRFTADSQQDEARLGEDRQSRLGALDVQGRRLGEDVTSQLGKLALQLAPPGEGNPFGGRAFQDRTSQLTRGQRENTEFGLDVAGQRAYQAAGAGWVPPGRGEPGGIPRNEFTDAQGNHRRTIVRGNETLVVDPSGRVLSRRPRRAG